MKGSGALQLETTNEMEDSLEEQNNILELGFNRDDLDYFFDIANDIIDQEQLIERYLEISRVEPYNQNWQNVNDAINSPYELNVTQRNGIPYNKNNIAHDALNSFYSEISGGKPIKNKKQIKNKKGTRKTRKTRKKRRARRTRRIYKKT
jgi:hypothetical protein